MPRWVSAIQNAGSMEYSVVLAPVSGVVEATTTSSWYATIDSVVFRSQPDIFPLLMAQPGPLSPVQLQYAVVLD